MLMRQTIFAYVVGVMAMPSVACELFDDFDHAWQREEGESDAGEDQEAVFSFESELPNHHFLDEVSIEINMRHHMAVSFSEDAGVLHFYFDGQLAGEVSATNDGYYRAVTALNGRIFLGEGPVGHHEYLSGALDDVPIYRRILLDEEVTGLYDGDGSREIIVP